MGRTFCTAGAKLQGPDVGGAEPAPGLIVLRRCVR